MARIETAGQIINDAALEIGLLTVSDPYSSQDQAFVQLAGLLNAAGRELVTMYAWQVLQKQFNITTAVDAGLGVVPAVYDLPDDFDRFINQTGWNRTANLPVPGPLSPQTWSMLTGRDFGSTTLYASFLLSENKMVLYPDPPPEGVNINFMYISRDWVRTANGSLTDRATASSEFVLFNPLLMVKFLKVKYLAAKGMDIGVASRDFDMSYMSITGQDKGADILSASGSRGYPYINESNVPFSGYGGA